jgi:2-polyprenyl-3-methyl-5-hydroxy-6-metoxy-1,4-benzoquinol methylase
MSDVFEYYQRRAGEHEEIYGWKDDKRQEEQGLLEETITGRRVLEVDCGISYSTKILSETVERIVAKNIGEDVIELTKLKKYSYPIEFERKRENANDLASDDDSFDGGLVFSRFYHIPRERIHPFLKEFHHGVQDGARVLIAETAMSRA